VQHQIIMTLVHWPLMDGLLHLVQRGRAPPSPLIAVPNVTAHPSAASVYQLAVSVVVCEIFSVNEWCDLENRVRVRSRSLEIASFDRSRMRSYSSSIVTMTQSCIICEI